MPPPSDIPQPTTPEVVANLRLQKEDKKSMAQRSSRGSIKSTATVGPTFSNISRDK